jgi:hypothetical protein
LWQSRRHQAADFSGKVSAEGGFFFLAVEVDA